MDAYLAGLEQARDAGLDLSTIHSVASFFVSRVDTEVDKRLDAIGTDEATALQRQGRRRQRPARLRGASRRSSPATAGRRSRTPAPTAQRPLWASTGVKNPDYPDTLYVTDLVVADTVNTMPEKTLEAFADHGEVTRRHGHRPTTPRRSRSSTASPAVGIDFDDVLAVLEHEGVDKFEKSWTSCVETVRARWRRPATEPGMSGSPHGWNTVPDGAGAAFELFFGYPDEAAFAAPVEQLVADRVASRHRRPGRHAVGAGRRVRGRQAARLGRPARGQSRPLVDRDRRPARRAAAAGVTRVVLCGMGGSSLAPEVICGAAGVELDVLDSSDPDFVRTALEDRPRRHRRRGVLASPAAPSRPTASGAPSRRRSPTPASTPPSGSSWSPTPAPRSTSPRREAGYRVFLRRPRASAAATPR